VAHGDWSQYPQPTSPTDLFAKILICKRVVPFVEASSWIYNLLSPRSTRFSCNVLLNSTKFGSNFDPFFKDRDDFLQISKTTPNAQNPAI